MNKHDRGKLGKIRILRILTGSRKSHREKSLNGMVLSGPEAKALEMCSIYNRQNFDTVIMYSREGKLLREFENIDISVELFDPKSKFNLSEILYIYQLIKKHKIDVLQTHGLRVDFFGFIAAKLAGIPHIITRHVAFSHHLISTARKRLYTFFDKFALKSAAKIITVSRIIENDLIENLSINHNKVVTIHNGVALDRYSNINPVIVQQIRDELGIDAKKRVVGMVAQLSNWKGIQYFLQAIPAVLKRHRDVVFLIVGDGPERKNLENIARELRISSHVIFAGFRRDIPNVISTMDISVLSSLREGLPNALLESMALGKPVVATDVGGVYEIVLHNKTGFLVPPRNPQMLADAIIEFLDNKAKAKKMGKTGRELITKNFSLKQMVAQYEKVYENVIAG